jgi:hypothetical protein
MTNKNVLYHIEESDFGDGWNIIETSSGKWVAWKSTEHIAEDLARHLSIVHKEAINND